jgi:hypothetical protein
LADVQVFPNPVVSELTIMPQVNTCLPLTIRLYDALGRLVLAHHRQRLDALTVKLDYLTPGMYWLQMEAQGQRVVRKLSKVNP